MRFWGSGGFRTGSGGFRTGRKTSSEQLRGQLDKWAGASHTREPARPPVGEPRSCKAEKEGFEKGSYTLQKAGAEAGAQGRVPHGGRSSSAIHRTSGACWRCGGGRPEAGRIADTRQVADVPPAPGAETTSHVAHDGMCGECGHVTGAPSLYGDGIGAAVRGTSLGPVPVSGAVQM